MKIVRKAGSFAGDKDAAAAIRDEYLRPALERGRRPQLDFEGVELATQSFVHALLAQTVRDRPNALERIEFRNCNPAVQSLIEIVAEYAQDQLD